MVIPLVYIVTMMMGFETVAKGLLPKSAVTCLLPCRLLLFQDIL